MALISAVFEAARADWEWIETNPVRGIKKLPTPPHRTSLWRYSETKRMLRALKYSPLQPNIQTNSQAIALAFLLALRTGMRAGELCGLTWGRTKPFYVTLEATKNGTARDVPLDSRARRLIEKARGWHAKSVLNLNPHSLDTLFRSCRYKAGLRDANLTFHDTRHTAATRLAKDLTMVDLCKMFGWKNPKYALIYYNPDAAGMAAHLDARRRQGTGRSNLDQVFTGGQSGSPIQ
jgi:integrase